MNLTPFPDPFLVGSRSRLPVRQKANFRSTGTHPATPCEYRLPQALCSKSTIKQATKASGGGRTLRSALSCSSQRSSRACAGRFARLYFLHSMAWGWLGFGAICVPSQSGAGGSGLPMRASCSRVPHGASVSLCCKRYTRMPCSSFQPWPSPLCLLCLPGWRFGVTRSAAVAFGIMLVLLRDGSSRQTRCARR